MMPDEASSPMSAGLGERKEWYALSKTWEDACEIARGKRGDFPFTSGEKEEMLHSLAAYGATLDNFLQEGLLTEAEAGLMKVELLYLAEEVQKKRPDEMRGYTCYRPASFEYRARNSVERISQRLALFEMMATARSIIPEVALKILDTMEMDLSGLAKTIGYLDKEEKRVGEMRTEEVRAWINKIRAHLKSGDALSRG